MRTKLLPLAVNLLLLFALVAILPPSLAMGQKSSKNQKRKKIKPPSPAASRYQALKISSKIELELGMKLPGTRPKMSFRVSTTGPNIPNPNKSEGWRMGGNFIFLYDAEWNGIEGLFGADDNWAINYITTSDLAFVTSEGLKVGDTAEKVLNISNGEVVKESDYEFSVRLPSGWYANFVQVEYDANGKLVAVTNGKLKPETKVTSFFKK